MSSSLQGAWALHYTYSADKVTTALVCAEIIKGGKAGITSFLYKHYMNTNMNNKHGVSAICVLFWESQGLP